MSQYNPKFVEEIKAYDPELYILANAAADEAYADGALDVKTKLLIAMALDAAAGNQGGVTSLASKARANGAREEEIKEALRIAYFISGMKVVKAATGVQG